MTPSVQHRARKCEALQMQIDASPVLVLVEEKALPLKASLGTSCAEIGSLL
jgi:hypothetical protein